MITFRIFTALLVTITVTNSPVMAQKKRIVQLEISAPERAELMTQQRWMEMLADVGADNVRSLTLALARQPQIKETQTETSTVIQVSGVIEGTLLKLPGKSFTINDKESIGQYIQKLRDDGAQIAMADKKAFGLTADQLIKVHQLLSAPLTMETKGKAASDVLAHVLQNVDMELIMNQTARSVMHAESPVQDQLQGLSYGTVLAAVLRPLGMVMTIQRKQGDVPRIEIVNFDQSSEYWPVGWPVDKPLGELHPKLMERVPLEIRNYQLDIALDAIQKRVELPFIFDQNAMARNGIDLSQTRVTLVHTKIAYMVAIQKLLAQTKPRMRAEVRIDEREQPFLWISTSSSQR